MEGRRTGRRHRTRIRMPKEATRCCWVRVRWEDCQRISLPPVEFTGLGFRFQDNRNNHACCWWKCLPRSNRTLEFYLLSQRKRDAKSRNRTPHHAPSIDDVSHRDLDDVCGSGQMVEKTNGTIRTSAFSQPDKLYSWPREVLACNPSALVSSLGPSGHSWAFASFGAEH